ncbi:hypothetical protein LOK46_25600 [Methylobacterium sp. NMS14P]|uniref:hypothetical protein n=1 Tax=Methylobacterium sp. NMS14P TaxID=2894310 RepID=UPI0023593B1B|nr:hypothetical protein [Methylobacterium sp. NMS14P]WCS24470.1 hypothetical protein LOK46_25600 [Methylobacterium sp. NMS14P]
MLGRRDKAKGLEAEVQSLEVRRAGVLNRLTDATARHEAAIAEQRRFLTETDGADARQAKAVAEACRKAADDRVALEDAARTLAGLIEDAKARLAAERDRRERDRTASEIEAGASAIEAAAVGLSRAAVAFDVAREALVAACRDHAPKDVLGGDCRHVILTAAARQAGITSREPDVSAMFGTFHVDAVPAAGNTVSAMRASAKAIREGAAPNTLPAKPEALPTTPTLPMVRACLWREAIYATHLNHRIQVFPGNVELPEPIAQAAFDKGVAFPPNTVGGQRVMQILRTDPNARLEQDGQGSIRAVRFAGVMGDGGRGLKPAEPPVFLGTLPDGDGVFAEAAQ